MENNKIINHWCVLCGAGYHSCDACSRERSFLPWRTLTDTAEHYKIFMVLKDYNSGRLDKASAREMLEGLDLTGKEYYRDGAKRVLADIGMDDESASDTRQTSRGVREQ